MTTEINEILKLKSALAQDRKLPSGCAFLSDDIILAYPQADGDARYPYTCDGLTLWAHSSGNIVMNESKFNIFPDTTRGKEPSVAFFVGEKRGDLFRPVSVTGAASGADLDVRRFVAFTKKAAYYFAETNKTLSVLRVFIDCKKRAHFSVCVKNKAKQKADVCRGVLRSVAHAWRCGRVLGQVLSQRRNDGRRFYSKNDRVHLGRARRALRIYIEHGE